MKNKQEIKKHDPEALKNKLLSNLHFPDDKDLLLKEIGEDIIPKLENSKGGGKENDDLEKKYSDKFIALLRILESDSHVCLMETFTDKYQMLSMEMCKNVIKEFNCTNEIEKSLVENIVNSYLRTIDNSRRLNNQLECKEITPNRNVYIANLSKQIDRSNRQYLSALMTLKQLKAPNIEMNIKATTAFISQNQQINVDKENNEAE